MQIPSNYISELYIELKFWLPAIGFSWGLFKVVQWFKSLKTNDLHHIQLGLTELNDKMDSQTIALKTEINAQTTAIVGELKELRNDFRAKYLTK